MEGTVKMFNAQKGYGFIMAGNKDYFVHQSNILMKGFRSLEDGQRVSFDPGTTVKGSIAVNVSVIGKA
jgi:CspA family cold shock protein